MKQERNNNETNTSDGNQNYAAANKWDSNNEMEWKEKKFKCNIEKVSKDKLIVWINFNIVSREEKEKKRKTITADVKLIHSVPENWTAKKKKTNKNKRETRNKQIHAMMTIK